VSRDYVLKPFRPPVNLQIDYARELNPQQHAAVTAPPGPALVIAGAGAGKTRTLIYRVAFLLEQGIPADRLLLLTFTNKAAREMMRRVADLLGHDLTDLWGGTFHAMGHRILRRHAELAGFRKDFTILDREDARDLMKACMGDADIDPKATRFPKADVVCEILSLAVNTQTAVPEIVAQHYDYFVNVVPQLQDLAQRYEARKRATNVMDFDDLLVGWLKLLQEQAEVREHYQRRFQFLLVDEYQDTNKIQAGLIDLLAARHRNVMVVGDDSQSIYSWRGANFQNILEFPRRYPGATVYKIETNYRSTPEILTLANAAIKANVHQFAKELAPVRRSGVKPVLAVCHDAGQQATFVAQRLLELREEGGSLHEMAVLYRSHFHALELQLELTRRNIPFSITSGIRFFEQAHLKDLTAYLKLACNPADELAFKRMVRLLPGVGAKAADKLWQAFSSEFRVANSALVARAGEAPAERSNSGPETRNPKPGTQNPAPESTPIARALLACARLAPKKAAGGWTQLALTFGQLEAPGTRGQPDKMIQVVLEAGYEEYLKETYANHASRLEDLEELATFARQFQTLEEFLTQLSLLTNIEAEDDRPVAGDDERVRLSTIHQAKGLEFEVVFVIMLCDGLFPNARSLKRPEDEEEERRLFYVAVTRARNELYLSYPLTRTLGGSTAEVFQQPSRFLGEIPKAMLDEWNLISQGSYA
jgi:DNA helicase-2/ATP-dependent DNA helicase PcrA